MDVKTESGEAVPVQVAVVDRVAISTAALPTAGRHSVSIVRQAGPSVRYCVGVAPYELDPPRQDFLNVCGVP